MKDQIPATEMNAEHKDFWLEKAAQLRRDLTGKVPGTVDDFLHDASISDIVAAAGYGKGAVNTNLLAAVLLTLRPSRIVHVEDVPEIALAPGADHA